MLINKYVLLICSRESFVDVQQRHDRKIIVLFFVQFSLSPSKDVPGFRRILPRANFLLLSKEYPSNQVAGSSQPDVGGDPLNPSLEGHLASVALTQDPQLTRLGLAGEVELSDQTAVDDDDVIKEPEGVPYPSQPCESPPSSSSALSKAPPVADGDHASRDSADNPASGVTLQGAESSLACHAYSGPVVQQGDATHTVAVIPAQVRHHGDHFNHSIIVMQAVYSSKCFPPLEPVGTYIHASCQLRSPPDDGRCRRRQRTECQTFI